MTETFMPLSEYTCGMWHRDNDQAVRHAKYHNDQLDTIALQQEEGLRAAKRGRGHFFVQDRDMLLRLSATWLRVRESELNCIGALSLRGMVELSPNGNVARLTTLGLSIRDCLIVRHCKNGGQDEGNNSD
jgi:hypothetical protein